MKNPLVSVIVPVYNHQQYIVECLDSILEQSYKNIEVIIIDDGSIDDSVKVINEYISDKQLNIFKLYTQSNQGVCKTLNRGVTLAKGDFITICASDDILVSDSISARLDYLVNNEDLLGVIGDALLIDSDSNIVDSSAMQKLYRANYNRLVHNIVYEQVLNWSVVGPTFMCKKCLYDVIGLYDEKLLVEDRDFYLRLLAINKLGFIEKSVAGYRIHLNNTSRKSIKSIANILNQVAISNINHAEKFKGILNIFLKSHKIDLYLLKGEFNYVRFYILFCVRAFRKLSARFILCFQS